MQTIKKEAAEFAHPTASPEKNTTHIVAHQDLSDKDSTVEITKKLNRLQNAFDVLEKKYHKAIENKQDSIPLKDITDVMQASEYYEEISILR